jgi:hypothetical protein
MIRESKRFPFFCHRLPANCRGKKIYRRLVIRTEASKRARHITRLTGTRPYAKMSAMGKLQPSSGVLDAKYYEVAGSGSLGERMTSLARDRIYDDFIRICRPGPEETILDVGVSDVVADAANVLERRYPLPERITAVGLGIAEKFRAAFPHVAYRQIAAGRRLPFADGSFDIATSNAVLEHVGSQENQRRFVAELMRVAARVFLIVPHRFFPVEHHTAIPFLHWTDFGFAVACRLFGKQNWSRPEHLILMSRRRLRAASPADASVQIGATGILLGPCSSNLYLYAQAPCDD